MASSLLLLLDDIATILDDIALMSKVAAKKTAGVLGDDLALNAQQVSGVHSDRELAVVWRVAKGSFWNKVILVPLAILISWLSTTLVTVLLMIGGLFLCYEGVEKVLHTIQHRRNPETAEQEATDIHQILEQDLQQLEHDKVKGAIRTDFILSAEIVVIALGTMAATVTLSTKFMVLATVSLAMTVGVYGLVAIIVKIDDAGLYLVENKTHLAQKVGYGLLAFAPLLMKFLSIVGTIAMFLVGGGIISHGIPFLHHTVDHTTHWLQQLPVLGSVLGSLSAMMMNFIIGAIAGTLVIILLSVFNKIFKKSV